MKTTLARAFGGALTAFISVMTAGILLDAVGCGRKDSGHQSHRPPASASAASARVAMPVRIATSKNLWCALTLIADKRGLFRAHGIEPELKYQAAGRLNMDALLGGAVDVANVVETNIAYQALNSASDLVVEGTIVTAGDYTILTRPGSAIRSAAHLKGKRLAYAQATGAESFLFWYIEKQALPSTALTLVPLQPAGLVDHFVGAGAEAVATWEPFVSTIRARVPKAEVLFEGQAGGFVGIMTVATRRNWADGHRDAIQAYRLAMAQASRFVLEEPAAAQETLATETGIPVETVRAIWKRFDFTYRSPSAADAQLVGDVVRRIIENVPRMKGREAPDVAMYFPTLAHAPK